MSAITEKDTKSILVVDNETNMRSTLSDILIGHGYDVTTATTGEEAIALCEQYAYDVILMDVRMPGVDGVEAFSRIRKNRSDAKVILMSAFIVDDLKNKALDAGAVAFLPKPLDVEQFLKLISEAKDTAILIVEDDPRLARNLQEQMRRQGYRVTVSNSPHDALELVGQIRFDLFFLGARLPVMSGLDLFLAIRKTCPSAVAVLLMDDEDSMKAIHADAVQRGVYTLVPKSALLDQFVPLVGRIERDRASSGMAHIS